MSSWFGVRRLAGVAGLAVVTLLAACTGDAETSSPQRDTAVSAGMDRSAQVSADGFTVSDGTSVASAPAGVAPAGTTVAMGAAEPPPVPTALNWSLAAPGFDLSLGGGLQPKTPVTVTTEFDAAEGRGRSLTFITQRSGTGEWVGLPVTVTGDSASVTMTHFSGGWFGWVNDAGEAFDKAINDYLKLRFDPPACEGKKLALDGVTYAAKINGNGIYVCVEEKDGSPAVSVHSNSPFVWRIAGRKGSVKPGAEVPPVDASGIVTLAAYHQLFGYMRDREVALVPGGSSWLGLTGDGAWKLTADVDAGLGLIAVVVAGVDLYLAVSGVSWAGREKAAVGECAAGVLEAGVKPDPGKVTRAVLDCLGTVVKGPAAVIAAVLSSLSSLLVTQVIGIAGEITQTNHLRIDVNAVAVPQEPDGVDLVSLFVGDWVGHTRTLTISKDGTAVESISSGCCSKTIDITYKLKTREIPADHPMLRIEGGGVASIDAVVTSVQVGPAWDAGQPVPKVGQRTTLSMLGGEITDQLTGTNFCDESRGVAPGTCGA